ncbi:hypothetical protein GDO78_015973 [Eleutherodactylus coqui]|uniref:Ig-like domain-containing protein n=1 Tax=Eleutherodactylus coqui TaxID=57060 RepID=A0A8J6C394_ELECQ|nr:hypothetical protein GDO78_015973 [Eleutherodactylus coqui]
MFCVHTAFIFFLCSSCTSNIIQTPKLETAAGKDLNLTCDHPSLPKSDFIHWYRLSPGQGPVHLIGDYKDTISQDKRKLRLIFSDQRTSSILNILDVTPEDSAVYLCAQGGTKLQIHFLPVQDF